MGYIGATPNSLFTFRPVGVTVTDQWRVLVSEFETGAEQRRAKWLTPKVGVRMRYDRGTLTADEANDVWRFWRAMEGPLLSFDLPLFGRLTTVESVFTAMDTSLGVADTQEFTSAAGSRYNQIYIQNAHGDFDTFFIAAVVDGTTLTVQSARFDNVGFSPGEPVSGVINARFTQPNMNFDYLVVLMSTVGLEFTEVRS